MRRIGRAIVVGSGLICFWQAIVSGFALPDYILPSPYAVLRAIIHYHNLLYLNAFYTISETFAGLVLGILFGSVAAILMAGCKPIRYWLLPVLVISQALPTFAIAPLLVIWFGYGIAAKIITTIIMVFYPVTSAFYDGLEQTYLGWLDMANTMRASKWRIFFTVRLPAALPQWASGVRVATVIAPLGAVVGEWVGASYGLGYLMLNANARLQIDLMFAALFAIIVLSLLLYYVVNIALAHWINWQEIK